MLPIIYSVENKKRFTGKRLVTLRNIMARFKKEIELVHCAKLGAELPALEKPPFPGELGQRIYDNVSKYAYSLWTQQATLIINHYGLNMADDRSHELLFQEMEKFFFGGQSDAPIVGAPAGKGAPARK